MKRRIHKLKLDRESRYVKLDKRKHLRRIANALGVDVEELKERGRQDNVKRKEKK